MIVRVGVIAALIAWLAAGPVACWCQQPPTAPLPSPPATVPAATAEEGEGAGEAARPAGNTEGQPEKAPTTLALAEDEYRLEADEVQYDQGEVLARGHVRIHHGDIVLTAREGRVDKEQVWAELSGNVLITSPNQRTQGDALRLNLDTGEWRLTRGRTQLEPSFFAEGNLKEPIFLTGDSLVSLPDRNLVQAGKSGITSCDLEHPHYEVTADAVDLRVGRDVTLDHPSLYLFGRRILRYPGKIRLSLRQRQSRLVPELGQNEVEGFYAKFAYPYDSGRSTNGVIRLNLTQKRGVGAGVDHYFDTGKSAGELSFFYEPKESAYSALIRHRYQFTPSLSTTLDTSLQTNSGYGLGTTSALASDLTLRNDTTDGHTSLAFQQSLTTGGGSSSRQFTSNLTHQQQGPAGIDWNWSSIWQTSSYGAGEPSADQANLALGLHRSHRAFDSDLSYKQQLNLGRTAAGQDSFLFSLDELPNLILRSDTERLGWKGLGVPLETRIEVGRFHQEPENLTLTRTLLGLQLMGGDVRLARNHSVQTGLDFRQGFYSDGSAQYDAQANAAFQSHWGGPWYSQLMWTWELPQGFAPVRTDFAAKQHYFDLDLSHYVANRSRVEIQTGYDLELNTWRDLLLRGEFTPSRRHRFEIQTAYDLNLRQLRPVEAQWQFVRQRHLNLTLSSSYDVENSQLGRVVLDSDWVVTPKWRLESLIGYDGSLRDFDFLEARLTRDLHCWLGSLSYSLSQREIRINFGLKAFPFQDWEYGVGNRGQMLTPSMSQYY